ncbi:MAG: RdgB/HAM1 family non-canonical purine NTP pyrophosphatase [Alphaproteobacteria bacterium]|nr:RdgB/HAM1 family non-canonical purine NTP pyrophosphatase [Alphaproteobacteria bacterium]
MARKFTEEKLVIASHNKGKVSELAEMMKPYHVKVISATKLNLDEPEENGITFIENAVIKAVAAVKASGMPALADDSGLAVHALDGKPGIHTARWAGADKNFPMAMKLVEDKLKGKKDRTAHFVCAIALAWPDGHVETFEGKVYGEMTWPMTGDKGFGFDPVFIPKGHTITFGEMNPKIKHEISHRAQAINMLVKACF